ncbi:hypothetical protein DDE82_004382 [Stemphylium lycopersici]|uniref:Uncharacterized protein n=1 Tax=Stemphylium lycopersici TaxID=183478 RepID=A0A364N6E3_STELY|nr:hypothetical protein TW65_05746 [Stemphylium lycopersici]RAR04668.1 hypothetical protein DDE82_004382 [Stemphylium lycopersici]RAR12812.1 hypothetical protein DDE83_003847 [Stemphylium lycopersici]
MASTDHTAQFQVATTKTACANTLQNLPSTSLPTLQTPPKPNTTQAPSSKVRKSLPLPESHLPYPTFANALQTEPITPHSSTNNSADDTTLHKTTTEKVKDAVKKPFTSSSSSSESSHKLGKRDITSSEMAAANEVLAAKDLKSP